MDHFDYIIVGAGLGGLSLAKELSKRNKKVLMLEKGRWLDQKKFGSIAYAATFYEKASLAKSRQGMPIYRCFGVGGTSLVTCNNAVEPSDDEIDRWGIDIRGALLEAKQEYGVSTKGFPIGKASRKIMDAANSLGYDMHIMPKFGAQSKCRACGACVTGCKYEAKLTALDFLNGAKRDNITIVSNFSVEKVMSSSGKVTGITGSRFLKKQSYSADKIVLSAGGLGTPVILQRSGIDAGNNLFVDIFNQTYGEVDAYNQSAELSMSVLCDTFHTQDGFIMSPFVDNFASFYPVDGFKNHFKIFKTKKMMGIMTKIRDENVGRVLPNGKIDKTPTQRDLETLQKGHEKAKEILVQCGAKPSTIFQTKPRGAHPGGTASIGKVVDNNLETPIKNLFVCDTSIFPYAPGFPPVLTLIAVTKWFANNQN